MVKKELSLGEPTFKKIKIVVKWPMLSKMVSEYRKLIWMVTVYHTDKNFSLIRRFREVCNLSGILPIVLMAIASC